MSSAGFQRKLQPYLRERWIPDKNQEYNPEGRRGEGHWDDGAGRRGSFREDIWICGGYQGQPTRIGQTKAEGVEDRGKGCRNLRWGRIFEFADLGADKYILTAQKKRYRKSKQTITLEEGESREIEIELRKTSKRIKGLLLERSGFLPCPPPEGD